MIHALDQIKALRQKYNLNQKELANRAGVSQSLIAKIESGKVDPTFTKAQQIFAALENIQKKEEVKAKEVMNSKVVFASTSETIKEVIKIMKSKGISQIPVMQKERVVGIISEASILEKIAEHPEKINTLKVQEVMDEVPPIVALDTGMKILLHLLQEFPIVLVAEKGDIKGIISKTDLLGKME